MRSFPFCAEIIKAKAIKCRFCNSDLQEHKAVEAPAQASTDEKEYVLYEAKLHWLIYEGAALILVIVLLIAVGTAIGAGKDAKGSYWWGVWFFLQFPLFGLVGAALRQYSSDFRITNKRLITKKGVLSRQTNEILLKKIETVSVNQGMIARMVDCGDVLLTGTGSAHKRIREISSPTIFRDVLTKAIAGEEQSPATHTNTLEGNRRDAIAVLIAAGVIWLFATLFAIFQSL